MKKTLLLLFGALVAIPAICQFPDTTKLGKRSTPIGYEHTYIDLFTVRYQQTVDKFLNTGGLINYIAESDGGNASPNTMVRVLASQIPMNADVKPQELTMIQNLINEVVKPGLYVPPTPGTTTPVFKEFVNDHLPSVTYQPGWIKAANQIWLSGRFANTDASISYNVGITGAYTFTGRKVELIAEKCDNHGKAKIVIKKAQTVVKTDVIDTYTPTGTPTNPATSTNWCPLGVVGVVYTSGDLPLDTYTIEFSLDEKDMTKVPARDSFVVDGLNIYE